MTKKEKKTAEKMLNILWWFQYHSKNLTKQQYIFLQNLKDMTLSLTNNKSEG